MTYVAIYLFGVSTGLTVSLVSYWLMVGRHR
jgi:hypothetical protein